MLLLKGGVNYPFDYNVIDEDGDNWYVIEGDEDLIPELEKLEFSVEVITEIPEKTPIILPPFIGGLRGHNREIAFVRLVDYSDEWKTKGQQLPESWNGLHAFPVLRDHIGKFEEYAGKTYEVEIAPDAQIMCLWYGEVDDYVTWQTCQVPTGWAWSDEAISMYKNDMEDWMPREMYQVIIRGN